jgi:hypothetical protein
MSLDQMDEASVARDGADTLHGKAQTCPGDAQKVARGSRPLSGQTSSASLVNSVAYPLISRPLISRPIVFIKT